MQKVYFPNGGFALYGPVYRAWYNADGSLKDCERKTTYRGAPAARAVPESHRHVRAQLEARGKREVATQRHAKELADYREAFSKNMATTQAALAARLAEIEQQAA